MTMNKEVLDDITMRLDLVGLEGVLVTLPEGTISEEDELRAQYENVSIAGVTLF